MKKKTQKEIIFDVKSYYDLSLDHMKTSWKKYYLCDKYDFKNKDSYFNQFLEYRGRVRMLEYILGIEKSCDVILKSADYDIVIF